MANEQKVELTKEDIIRGITDPSGTNFQNLAPEQLDPVIEMLTPEDEEFTPMLTRLSKKEILRSKTMKFEWVDNTVNNTHSTALYDGNTPPTSSNSATNRQDNYIMPLAKVAEVSKFVDSFESVETDYMTNELRDRTLELRRAGEYYLWNGDRAVTTPCQQTDGIKKLVTQAVSNENGGGAAQVIQESSIKTALVQVYSNGYRPKLICATPTVASRIADFSLNHNTVRPNGINGNVEEAFTYRSPFGFKLTVVPVLEDFIGNSVTGEVFVLDDSKMKLVIPSKTKNLINSEELGTVTHGKRVIVYMFMGLQMKANTKSQRKITNVLNQ